MKDGGSLRVSYVAWEWNAIRLFELKVNPAGQFEVLRIVALMCGPGPQAGQRQKQIALAPGQKYVPSAAEIRLADFRRGAHKILGDPE